MSELLKSLNHELRSGDLASALPLVIDALGGASETGLGVREARDRFTQILREARSGRARVVGIAEDDQVVIISAKELTGLLAEVLEARSFVEAVCSGPGYDATPETVLRFEERPRSAEMFVAGSRLPAITETEQVRSRPGSR